MPKGQPINNPDQDEAIYEAHLSGETMASIADRLCINLWNVNDACKRVRQRRRREQVRNSYADWRDVPIRYSTLSPRARDAVESMGTLGELFNAIEREGETLFKYSPNVGSRTIHEIMTWFQAAPQPKP
jgi:hypothetical protein